MRDLLKSVSSIPLGFGGGAISGEGRGYSFGEISETQAISLLHAAYERGIKVFDTAPIYGFGHSEVRMGKAFKKMREEVFIVSKCGVSWHENRRVNFTNEPKVAQKMLEESLLRLDSDYIDLYMIHWPDKSIDIRKPMEVLVRAKEQKKILHIGLSNTHLEDLARASEVAEIEAVQSQYNIFEREVEKELLPYLKDQGISFMSWGTLDKGIISGTVNAHRKFDEYDSRSWAPWWKKTDHTAKFKTMERILPMLEKEGFSGLGLALGHNLAPAQDCMALCGARSISQLNSLLETLESLAPPEIISQAHNLYEEYLES